MILRRFMQHVKEQNWFAVGLDVIVVIVGIFLGMQVTEWNEERKKAAEEAYFLERLHREISDNVNRVTHGLDFRIRTLSNLNNDLDHIKGMDVKWIEGEHWCTGITGSHIFLDYSTPIPALEELISTGKLWSLKNDKLRHLLTSHLGLTKYMQGVISRMASKSNPINEAFPDLVVGTIEGIGNPGSGNATRSNCNVEEMRQNSAFINQISNQTIRFSSYINLQKAYLDRLKGVHSILDDILSLTHKELDTNK